MYVIVCSVNCYICIIIIYRGMFLYYVKLKILNELRKNNNFISILMVKFYCFSVV